MFGAGLRSLTRRRGLVVAAVSVAGGQAWLIGHEAEYSSLDEASLPLEYVRTDRPPTPLTSLRCHRSSDIQAARGRGRVARPSLSKCDDCSRPHDATMRARTTPTPLRASRVMMMPRDNERMHDAK